MKPEYKSTDTVLSKTIKCQKDGYLLRLRYDGDETKDHKPVLRAYLNGTDKDGNPFQYEAVTTMDAMLEEKAYKSFAKEVFDIMDTNERICDMSIESAFHAAVGDLEFIEEKEER